MEYAGPDNNLKICALVLKIKNIMLLKIKRTSVFENHATNILFLRF